MTQNKKFSFSFAKLAIKIENLVFPIIFLLFTLQHIYQLIINKKRVFNIFSRINSGFNINDFLDISDALLLIAIILFNFFIAYVLIIRKNLHQEPEGILEIFIPLIATFWTFVYNIIPYLPKDVNFPLIPEYLFLPFLTIGSIFTLLGVIVASISILTLKKSFGIFVQVRDIVTKGPYRFVRHPMYFGHIMSHLGFLFLSPRLYSFILSLLLIGITIFRAKLEERKLALYSKEYQEYMQVTSFLLPIKWFSKK